MKEVQGSWEEKILKEFDELSAKEIDNGGWNIPYEGISQPKCREWLSQAIDKALQAKVESIADSLSEIQSSCHSWQEYNRKISDLLEAIKKGNK